MVGIVALRAQFDGLPEEVRNHFRKMRPLLINPDLDIGLAYAFMLIEQGRYRSAKCILVRKLRCGSGLVDKMFQDYEFQRKTFRKMMRDLISVDIADPPYNALEEAEMVRDKLLHGRKPQEPELRLAVSKALSFVEHFGERVRSETGKNPFGDLRGLSARLSMLPSSQAKWIIDGVKLKAKAS